MRASHLVRASLGAVFTFVIGCSAASPGAESGIGLSSEELRALGSSEILGDLQYGQTSASVAYTENPKYRAFRFQGRAGDSIDAWVRSTSGDARAWLLDASFQNVVSNDDANASTHDAHVVATLTHGGTFYIAFREATFEDASFVVSLQGRAASSTCDPEVENCGGGGGGATDPFDDASCSGPPITVAEAERWFPLAAVEVTVTAATGYIQKRQCVQRAAGPECSPWTDAATSKHDLVFTQSGARVRASLRAASSHSDGREFIIGSNEPPTGYVYVGECVETGPTTEQRCYGEPSTFILAANATVTLTRTCVRATGFSYSSATNGATSWYERRAVVLGRFAPR